eukprot:TRINITY_DN472_c0_g1_i3.p1 TRINITY_DN472_c0_g1~~TRINITY_DN472_c0_g1_i3.p1  ORF type:complete len:300 (-),score=45.19 TRINITY_DN472_c0_g1_i3:457-1356(-)
MSNEPSVRDILKIQATHFDEQSLLCFFPQNPYQTPHTPLLRSSIHSLWNSKAMATIASFAQVATTPVAFSGVFSSKPRWTNSVAGFGSSSSTALRAMSDDNSGKSIVFSEWMPGQPRPAHLDGSSPGDFGFDPLGLGVVPENLERYKESELIHCRWAMLAVPGMLIPEALGLGNWVDAQKWAAEPGGQATYLGAPVPWGTLPVILSIEFLAIAFVESQRNGEKDVEKRKYPGGPFDPLGFSKDPVKLKEYKLKEIKNGGSLLSLCNSYCSGLQDFSSAGICEKIFEECFLMNEQEGLHC